MKKLSFIAFLLVIWSIQACNNPRSKDSVSLAKDENKENDSLNDPDTSLFVPDEFSSTTRVFDDSDFAVEAADGGMLEVQLGKIAVTNASDQAVKDFGQMMVDDHNKINTELMNLAKQKDIVLPPAPSNRNVERIKKLNEKAGEAFERDYIDLMVSDHKKDIDKFEYASKSASDTDIKAFASKTLPILRNHLAKAKALQDNFSLKGN